MWVNALVLDNGLNYIKDNGTALHLINGYTNGDSYAVVVAASICEVTIDSTDFTLDTPAATSNRRITLAAQSGTADGAASGTPPLHYAIVDVANTEVLWVTDESNNPTEVAISDPVEFAAVAYTSSQPT